jgi:indolepyruvate ferredoxin oxidoreductase beta subunit
MTTPNEIDLKEYLENGKILSVVFTGVGGQGTLIAGKLLGIVAMKLGMDVKVSEVHGMSQRGGSVITYVRMGKEVFSPIIDPGTADYCLVFEALESIRWASLLKAEGTMIISSQQIKPLPVLLGKEVYPTEICGQLQKASAGHARIIEVDAITAALSTGSAKAVNMVMLGALSVFTHIPLQIWEESIEEAFSTKPKLVPMNRKAFQLGRDLVQ